MKKVIYAILGLVAVAVLASTIMYLIKSNTILSLKILKRRNRNKTQYFWDC